MKIVNTINLYGGKITYNDLDNINLDEPLENQRYKLDQDLLQIKYGEEYIIDIGWYPDFSLDGSFIIQIIEDYDWDDPLLRKKVTPANILTTLEETIEYVVQLQKNT